MNTFAEGRTKCAHVSGCETGDDTKLGLVQLRTTQVDGKGNVGRTDMDITVDTGGETCGGEQAQATV